MTKTTPSLGLAAMLSATSFVGIASAANVIVNSDFDNDSGSALGTNGGTVDISGWGSMHLYKHSYNGTQGPKLSEVGDQNYGINDDIVLGDDALTDTYKGLGNASQTVNLTTALDGATLTALANGTVEFAFSSWMAGWSGDNNTVATRLRFFDTTDGTGTALATYTLDRGVTTNQVTTADFLVNGSTGTAESDPDYWALYEIQAIVPTTAQSVIVDFVAGTGHAGGGSNDWYVDQVVVDIAAVPEPSSTALLGLGAVGFLLRRRR
ncbi:PEP-CTERM sorting domain-containing protein [Rubritalea halochordaticola]